jgi:TolA-binding protein
MKHAEKLRLIESHYRGDINEQDRVVLETLLQDDPDFRLELESYEVVFMGFESLHVEDFQQQLVSFEQKFEEQVPVFPPEDLTTSTTVIRPIKSFYYAAAAVAVLLCAVFGYNQMNHSPFDNNFVADSNLAIHLSSMRAGDQNLSGSAMMTRDAFSAYQTQDFKSTIEILQKYQQDYSDVASKDYQSYLVLGVAQLANGAAEAAKNNFNKIIEAKDSSNKLSAQWYLSLAEVKLENYVVAQQILEELTNCEDTKIKKDAKQLLSDL